MHFILVLVARTRHLYFPSCISSYTSITLPSMSKKNIELAGTATIGPKGQVVIPVNVRQQMNIEPGDKVVVLYLPDRQAVGFIPQANLQHLIDQAGQKLDLLQQALHIED